MNTVTLHKIAELDTQLKAVTRTLRPLMRNYDAIAKKRLLLICDLSDEILANNKPLVNKLKKVGACKVFACFENKDNTLEVFENDGRLIITFGKIKGVFAHNLDKPRRVWNTRAKEIMTALDIPAHLQQNGLIKTKC